MPSSRQLYETNIFHDFDHEKCRGRLDGLYGRVAADQNRTIIDTIAGSRVLDAGAGYGTLTKHLLDRGFNASGLELNEEKVLKAREWYGVTLVHGDIYSSAFADGEFDCVILREVVFHLDFEKALREIRRICRNQVIIFQGNNVLLRRAGQRLHGHKEFNEKGRDYYVNVLQANGYSVAAPVFRDLIAFPLSGGWIGRQWIPSIPATYEPIIGIDRTLNSILRILRMQPFFCLRFLISATLPKRERDTTTNASSVKTRREE